MDVISLHSLKVNIIMIKYQKPSIARANSSKTPVPVAPPIM